MQARTRARTRARIRGSVAALLLLAACATSPPPSSDADVVGAPTKAASQKPSDAADGGAHGGDWTVRLFGTPFYWAFKAVSCVTTVAIVAPASAVLALRPEVYEVEAPALGDTVAGYCGSPWVLPSPAASG